MTAKTTAVTLSHIPSEESVSQAYATVRHISTFSTLEELHAQRLEALDKVTTEAAIFVDDTDQLSSDFSSIVFDLSRVGIVHFDTEMRRSNKIRVMRGNMWTPDGHRANTSMIHNAVFSMEAYRRVRKHIPHGLFWTEFVLYFALAKICGSEYLPRVAYIWNCGVNGMHAHPAINQALMNSVAWSRGLGKMIPGRASHVCNQRVSERDIHWGVDINARSILNKLT